MIMIMMTMNKTKTIKKEEKDSGGGGGGGGKEESHHHQHPQQQLQQQQNQQEGYGGVGEDVLGVYCWRAAMRGLPVGGWCSCAVIKIYWRNANRNRTKIHPSRLSQATTNFWDKLCQGSRSVKWDIMRPREQMRANKGEQNHKSEEDKGWFGNNQPPHSIFPSRCFPIIYQSHRKVYHHSSSFGFFIYFNLH